LKAGVVTVKEQQWHFVDGVKQKVIQENTNRGVTVKRDELIGWLKAHPALQDWQNGKLIS